MELRSISDGELGRLAELAAPLQAQPESHIVYLGTEAAGIAAELEETTWSDVSAVAVVDDEVIGWMIGDVDPDVGRVRWFGPFVRVEPWEATADALLASCREQLGAAITEEEMAVDERFERCCRWAVGEGFIAGVGSFVLELDGPIGSSAVPVRDITTDDRDVVIRLHEELFAGTHTTGLQLVSGHDEARRRLVVERDGVFAGYIAVELEADGSGYIDFVGVEQARRRQGLGADLVRAGVAELRRLGADSVGLTVRADSAGARELYASLGFREERLAVPLRRGFSLG